MFKAPHALRHWIATLPALLAMCLCNNARADSIEDFYHGKTVSLYIGTTPGGGYDTYARFVARFLGAHIPGHPLVVPVNMPGAGGRTAAGYIYTVAAKDGLSLGTSDQALPLAQAVGDASIKFDTSKLNWIGSTDSDNKVVVTWFASGVKTIEDARREEVTMGAPSETTGPQYLNAMNSFAGTRFKIISGYPGINETNLAMERGEVAGVSGTSWATWKTKPDMLRDHKINVIVQIGFNKAPELPDVPLLMELGGTPDADSVLELLSAPTAIGHPIYTSPGVPIERVKALREAFDATLKDPALLEEAKKIKLQIDPTPGEKLQQIASDIQSAPRPVKDRLAAIVLDHK